MYMWIDALCIIQGDLEDWNTESSKMASYYGAAWLTISASGSKDSTQSCMPTRNLKQLDDVHGCEPVTLQSSNDRLHVDFEENHQLDRIPIFTRAWALQERLLSRRLLHMTPREAKWDCCNGIECECPTGPGYNERRYCTKSHYRQAATYPAWPCYPILGFEYWHNFLNRYHWRKLTFSSDKLKAIQAIAQELQAAQRDNGLFGQYILGIWDGRLFLRNLLWQPREGTPRPRARNPLFPSWTWASMEGSWSYEFPMAYPHRAEEEFGPAASCGPQWTGVASATVVEKLPQAWDIDHGHRKNYPLVLSGNLLCLGKGEVAESPLKRYFDIDSVDDDAEVHSESPLWYLRIWSEGLAEGFLMESNATSCLGLILEAVSGRPGTFTRLGIFRGEPKEFCQAQQMTVTII